MHRGYGLTPDQVRRLTVNEINAYTEAMNGQRAGGDSG